jgi:hypothetical protein
VKVYVPFGKPKNRSVFIYAGLHNLKKTHANFSFESFSAALRSRSLRDGCVGSKSRSPGTPGLARQNRVDSLNESLKRHAAAGHFNPLSIHPTDSRPSGSDPDQNVTKRSFQQGKPQLVEWMFRSLAFVWSNLHHRIVAA